MGRTAGFVSSSGLALALTFWGADLTAGQPDPLANRIKQAGDLLSKNSTAAAMAILEPLIEDPAIAAQPSLHADVLLQAGLAHFQRNEYPKALDYYGRAVEVARKAGTARVEARALLGIGQSYKNQGSYSRSLEFLRLAIARYEAIGDNDGLARAWMVLASVQDLMGQHRGALESYAHAQRLFGGATHAMAVRLLNEIGITHKNLGDYEAALDHYRRALAAQIDNGDRYGQAVTLHNTAVVYGLLGESERAVEYYQRSLAIAREINERRGQTILLGNIGELLLKKGELARAFDFFQQQLQLTRDLGNRNEEALALQNLGRLYAIRGDVALARKSYEGARTIQQDIGAKARLGSTLLALAGLDLAGKEYAASAALAEQALAIATETDSPELSWRARLTLARAARAAGRTDAAVAHLEAGTRLVNDLRANVRSDSGKIGFVDDRQEIFHELASVLVSTGRAAEALAAAEAGRARAFADLLEQRQTIGRQRAQSSLQAVRSGLDEMRAAHGPTAQDADAARRRTGALVEENLIRLRSEDRELSSLITAESPDPNEIIAITRRLNAVVVEYLVTDRELIVWTVSPAAGIQVNVVTVGREDLTARVNGVRALIDNSPASRATLRLNARLRELHELLITPVQGRLPHATAPLVVIVPDGPLALLPFAALPDAAGSPLIARHTLAAVPSIAVYRYTPDKTRVAQSTSDALVIADPAFPSESRLPSLPNAREEGRLVARHLPPQSTTLLLGRRASEAVVKRTASSRSILHFATHGIVSAERPLASSIVLAPGDGEDGYLRASEVFTLALTADLVVLSGCSTGLGQVSGDGIVGLSRAFIYAGTPRVLVSQWDVSDQSTAYLMDRFYAGRRAGRGAAAALRTAQLETRRRYPHPSLWAAFVLIGEAH